MDRRRVIFGAAGFPVAMAGDGPFTFTGHEREADAPLLWYVWAFNGPLEDFEPVGAYTNEADARAHLERLRVMYEKRIGAPVDHAPGAAALQQTWAEFVAMATNARLGELAEPLKKLVGLQHVEPFMPGDWG